MKMTIWFGIIFFVACCGVGALMKRSEKDWPTIAAASIGTKPFSSVESFRDIFKAPQEEAAAYIYPGLFPLDLLFLCLLGGTIALLSLGLGEGVWPSTSMWMLLILPVGYMMADLFENLLFAWILGGARNSVSDGGIIFVKTVTILKSLLLIGGGIQLILLLWAYCRSASSH